MTTQDRVVKRLNEMMSSLPNSDITIVGGAVPEEVILQSRYGDTVMPFNMVGDDIVVSVGEKKLTIPIEKHQKPELVN